MSSSHSEEEEEFILKCLPSHNETVSFNIRSPSYIPNEPTGTSIGKTIKEKGTGLRDFNYSTPSNTPIDLIHSDVSCQVVDPSDPSLRDSTSHRGDMSSRGWHAATGSKSRENPATLPTNNRPNSISTTIIPPSDDTPFRSAFDAPISEDSLALGWTPSQIAMTRTSRHVWRARPNFATHA